VTIERQVTVVVIEMWLIDERGNMNSIEMMGAAEFWAISITV